MSFYFISTFVAFVVAAVLACKGKPVGIMSLVAAAILFAIKDHDRYGVTLDLILAAASLRWLLPVFYVLFKIADRQEEKKRQRRLEKEQLKAEKQRLKAERRMEFRQKWLRLRSWI